MDEERLNKSLRKIFAKIDELNQRIDPSVLEDLRKEMRTVSAESRVVISTMRAHGAAIHRLDEAMQRLHFHCPMFKLEEDKKAAESDNGRDSSPYLYNELDDSDKKD